MSEARDKIGFVEMWRGIAIITVVWHHYTARIPYSVMGADHPAAVSLPLGKIGVLIFFVISGYLIAASLRKSPDLASFYAKRISRIWPLFIAATLFVTLAMQFLDPPVVMRGQDAFYSEERHWYDVIGSLFFLADFGFQWADGAYWSILVELKFYALVGLFAAASPKHFDRWFALLALCVSGPQILIEILMPDRFGGMIQMANGLLIARYLPFFAVGILLYSRRFDGLITACIMIVVARLFLVGSEVAGLSAPVLLRFMAIFGVIVAIDGVLLGGRMFRFVGRYSYSLYLFHQMIGLSLIKLFVPHMPFDAAIIVAFALVMALAVAMSEGFEWRFRRYFNAPLHALFSRVGLGRFAVSPGASGTPPSPERRRPA